MAGTHFTFRDMKPTYSERTAKITKQMIGIRNRCHSMKDEIDFE